MLHYKPISRKRKCPVQCQAEAQQDYRSRSKQDVRVLVAGSTGYIGKYVTKELIQRGYNVVAFAREKSGVGGKQSREQTQKVLFPSHLYSSFPCSLSTLALGVTTRLTPSFVNFCKPHSVHQCSRSCTRSCLQALPFSNIQPCKPVLCALASCIMHHALSYNCDLVVKPP